MVGGDNDDTYYVDSLSDRIVEAEENMVLTGYGPIQLALDSREDITGIDKVYSSVSGYRMPQNVEKMFLTDGAERGYGNTQDNEITGNSANNWLFGYGGDDKLFDQSGDDFLAVGHGSSEVDGGSGIDTFSYMLRVGETASLSNGRFRAYEGTEKVTDVTLSSIEKARITGTRAGDSIIVAGSTSSWLNGLHGDDYVQGGDGNDTLLGGNGHDFLIGHLGSDTLVGGQGNDTLLGVIHSASTNENGLFGEGTIDKLTGGPGNDTFVLGDGSRTFYNDGDLFSSGLADFALIEDFKKSEDTIRLHGNVSDYRLGAVTVGADSGVGIYLTNAHAGQSDELVGLVKGQNSVSLTANYFEYIA